MKSTHVISLFVAAAILGACGGAATPEAKPQAGTAAPSTSAPRPTTAPAATTAPTPTVARPPTATPVPTATPAPTQAPFSLPPATPDKGKANVEGHVVWNGKPAANISVRVCEDLSTLGGCKGRKYESKTNAQGDYRITGIEPGEYSFEAKAFDSVYWLFTTQGAINARKFALSADKTEVLRPFTVYKLDLKVTNPRHKASVKDARPLLTWDKYPGADYYEIYLAPKQGEALLVDQRVYAKDGAEIAAPSALQNCAYSMRVEAFNADKVKIAEHEESYVEFTVTNQATKCVVDLTAPRRDATVAGAGLKLAWEAHAQADEYRVVLYPTDKPSDKVLDFVRAAESVLTLDKTLEPGKYTWWVQVIDKQGKRVAGSEPQFFTVK